MKQGSLLLFLFVLLIPSTFYSQWVSLSRHNGENISPEIKILEDSENATIINIKLSGFLLREIVAENKTYHQVDLLTEKFMAEPGYPAVPYIAEVLAIPDDAALSIEVLEKGAVHKFENINLSPARESWWEGADEPAYREDVSAYRSSGDYPSYSVSHDDPAIFRDFRIARVAAYPVKYNASLKELEVTEEMTIKVNYLPGQAKNPKKIRSRGIAPSYGKLYRGFIFNYESVLKRKFNGEEGAYDVMLVIMPDEYYDTFQPYAEWRNRAGTKIRITKFSEIGANSGTPEIVKEHIANTYESWEHPPTYVLLMGDDGKFPVKYIHYDWTFVYDNFFAELEGNDYFPDVMYGRFTHQGNVRLEIMMNKYLNYMKDPLIDGSGWLKKAIVCSNNAYPSQVETKRYTAEVMYEDGGYTYIDTVMSKWPCPADVEYIAHSINEGRGILNYRGEGWTTGWSATCYNFNVGDVYDLSNGMKLPFVTSIGCGVGMFDAGQTCFGEAWIQTGTIEAPRGACAFIGPTSNTHTTYNNKIDKGIYIGLYKERMDRPGQVADRGKLYMYNVFGNTQWVEYHFRIYVTLGDPALQVWKDIPENVTVTHPDTIGIGYDEVVINVAEFNSGLASERASVCLASEEFYAVGLTNGEGNVTIPVNTTYEDTMTVTVYGQKIIPYEGEIIISGSGSSIYQFEADITVADGNGSGSSNTLTFGMNSLATDGLDQDLGEAELPPVPPAGVFDTRFILPGETIASLKDLRSVAEQEALWTIQFQPGADGYPFVFSWNPDQLSEGYFILKDPLGAGIVDVNMKEESQVIVENSAITSLKIYYSRDMIMQWQTEAGWNLVSLPVEADDMSFSSIFPDASSNAFIFVPGDGYQVVSQGEVGKGYWLKFESAAGQSMNGGQHTGNIPVEQGWNLMGPMHYPVNTDDISSIPAGIIASGFFSFSGGYSIADELHYGHGYWVKSSEAGELVLNMAPAKKNPVNAENTAAYFEIPILATDGIASYDMMIGIDPAATDGIDDDLGEAELPPAPPAGIFDSRMILPDGITGSLYDFRNGGEYFVGGVEHKIQWQLGTGTEFSMTVSIPEQYPKFLEMTVKDPFGGTLVYETIFSGETKTIVVTNAALTSLDITIHHCWVPVELTTFTAEAAGEKVELTWETATETNNKGFEVERSSDDVNFSSIGFVDGNGTSTEANSYSFVDFHATSGTYYYRLKQVDFDGTFAYSEVVEVDFVPTEFSLGQNYPNPFNPVTKIKFALPVSAKVSVKVYNVVGQQVAELINSQFETGLHEVEFDASKFSSGVYFYSIEASGIDGQSFSSTKKMMLMK